MTPSSSIPDLRTATPTVRILGSRGVPAAHGGFETFAERLSVHLAARGWDVTVYCQRLGSGASFEDRWQGVRRRHFFETANGPVSTLSFDARAVRHAARTTGPCLVLGYNSAIFGAWLRAHGVPQLINMDGIEWSRAKWGLAAKAWLRLNERAACRVGDVLVADHPAIADHLAGLGCAARTTMIPYGADLLSDVDPAPLAALGLAPGRYLTLIARVEPENAVLELVRGFSARRRGVPLAVLGNMVERSAYHRAVRRVASDEVRFFGAIHDRPLVQALRFHALAHLHGHQAGGTNPSLVEAIGAGNAVVAHDNRYNRWVLGDGGALYFTDSGGVDAAVGRCLGDPGLRRSLAEAARRRFTPTFTWPAVLAAYEALLLRWQPQGG